MFSLAIQSSAPSSASCTKEKAAPSGCFFEVRLPFSLKSELWSNRDSQVMVRPTVEVHLIAHLAANTQPSGEQFNTSSRIENRMSISISDPIESIGHLGACGSAGSHAEIDEPALQHRKYL